MLSLMYPEVDPLPVPAPLWIFKVLLYVTFALHITLVQVLIGWSMVAAISLLSKNKFRELYDAIAPHLPNIIAFTVNLGVPPLLFTQVLYGRALYTSSILIGMFWFGVIIILIIAYFFSYRSVQAPDSWKLKPWLQWFTFLSFIYIAWTYVNNFTLMIRPEVWREFYNNSPTGWNHNMSDPIFWPRLLFFLFGALVFGGLAMIWLYHSSKTVKPSDLLKKYGAIMVMIGVPLQVIVGIWALNKHLAIAGGSDNILYTIGLILYPLIAVVIFGLSIANNVMPKFNIPHLTYILLAVLYSFSITVIRDLLRDKILLSKQFNVWDRYIVTNWPILIIFVILFLIGVVALYWLLLVLMKKPTEVKNG